MRRLIHSWHARYDQPFVMYFHVWELDAELPRISAAPAWTRLRQYRNLDRMPALLRHYLSRYSFTPVTEYLGIEPQPAVARESREVQVGTGVEQTTREQVPVLFFGPGVKAGSLGVRGSFADMGQTQARHLGLAPLAHGKDCFA